MVIKKVDPIARLRIRDTQAIEPGAAEDLRRRLLGSSSAAAPRGWHLETVTNDGQLRRVTIGRLPFRIGRLQGLELTLPADSLSKNHAEIFADGDVLRIRDLGSRNGTFVNGESIVESEIHEGDILHFAEFEFRLDASAVEAPALLSQEEESATTVSLGRRRLSDHFVRGGRELKELLDAGSVTVVFQPLVLLAGNKPVAYEALGRGQHPDLPQSPLELFRIAESIGAEAELSRLFRRKAVELVAGRTDFPAVFLNTHPAELSQPGLLESLEELRRMAPRQDLALEIHEGFLTRASSLTELRALLSVSNIGLVYDNFGAGQARLLEFAEAPPHYVRFDRRFVRDIHKPEMVKRRRLLSSLVGVARDLLVKTIADGVETAEEAEVCRKIGFVYGQGYHFGLPLSPDRI
jgi:EAL domain-containing protein (putative c-di-GMP-specific phosphodiesterase class I)/pSer/pThr/pTyr-binding forkhead associated (FHA) protein